MTHDAAERPPIESIPTDLYEEARRRLLSNWPLRSSSPRGVVGLTAPEADVLRSVGLSAQPWDEGRDDPLRRSIADYMALLETSLTAAGVAKRLGVGVSRIRQRIRERSLFAIEYEAKYRLPRFQFERQQVLPGLREILGELPGGVNPLDVAQWFLAPHLDLASEDVAISPRDWLLHGESVDTVVRLARAFE